MYQSQNFPDPYSKSAHRRTSPERLNRANEEEAEHREREREHLK
jgi:hypothetical protein